MKRPRVYPDTSVIGGCFDAVEMVRKIRDDIYEETKALSDEELMRYFKERSRGVLSPGGEVGGKKTRERATA